MPKCRFCGSTATTKDYDGALRCCSCCRLIAQQQTLKGARALADKLGVLWYFVQGDDHQEELNQIIEELRRLQGDGK